MVEAQPPDRRQQQLVGERATLEAFLDDYRDIVVRKASGLSDADARRALVTSPTTVGGLIKHLRPNRLEQCLSSPTLNVPKEQRVRHCGRCRVDLRSAIARHLLPQGP